MKYQLGQMTTYIEGLEEADRQRGETSPYQSEGLFEVEKALNAAIKASDKGEDQAHIFCNELAALMGHYIGHVLVSTHDGYCLGCTVSFLTVVNRYVHNVLAAAAQVRAQGAQDSKAVPDGPDLDASGPEDGQKVN